MSAPVDKRALIRQYASGRSFIDIGGLWGTKGEMVTSAALGGATTVTMADIQAPGNPWWQRFRERCAEFGVDDCAELHVDICSPTAPNSMSTWALVHSSGLMYHVPDLFSYIGNLVRVSSEYLLVSSFTMPPRLANEAGTLEFGADEAHLAPLLSSRERAVLRTHLESRGMRAAGITHDATYITDEGAPQTGPWWWLFSNEFMVRFLRLFGLDIVLEGPTPSGLGYTVLARVPDRLAA